MGSSKKHKEKDKEHKKKKKHKEKDRSRSKSRERKHKKDKKHSHEDHEYDYGEPEAKRPRDSYYEDQDYLDSHDKLESDYNERVRGNSEKKRQRNYYEEETSVTESFPVTKGRRSSPPAEVKHEQVEIPKPKNAGGDVALSIEETNRLRAKLGLKPLEGTGASGGAGSSSVEKSSSGIKEDVHVPAINISNVRKQEELRQKLLQAKEKRRLNKMLGKVKTLGDSDDDDDAFAWVKKSRRLQHEREMAAKRAKMLEEMDEEFGIGDLVEEEFGKKQKEYSSKDLKGIKVDHAQDSFKEGKTVILTLKDRGVLDEDYEDTLMNVNMMDDEHAQENIENKKKKIDYKPYEEDERDEYGMLRQREVLEKYNEEIDGKKKETFELGKGGKYDAQHERRMIEIRQQLQQQGQALSLPPPVLAREFYTEDEMAGFKKVKKKVRKIRKKPKMVTADDLLPLEPVQVDHGSRSRNRPVAEESEEGELIEDKKDAIPGLDLIDVVPDQPEELLGPDEDLTGVTVEDEAGIELELALNKARKLKVKKEPAQPERLAENIEVKEESSDESEEEDEMTMRVQPARNITLNQTSEFCRSLGEIPTYGMAGNRREDEEDELMDFEKELAEERQRREQEDEQSNWQQVEIDTRPVDITTNSEQRVLDDEPMLNEGLAAALNLAVRKGYIEKEVEKIPKGSKGKGAENIEAINYSIEDKRYDDLDEKYRKRDRFGGGMVSDFKEKLDYRPEVKIEYIDDQGRHMCEKEAFRYLSHRFHGKGSGKLKTERRNKQYEQEQLMKSMTSTDTPLQTASMLERKLEKEKTPYIVLSGANKNAPITKT